MKKWLTERFLPMWAKETVLADNRRLRRENAALYREVREQQAYIRGIRAGMRSERHRRGGKR